MLAELENIRRNGYATDKEEFGRGIVCVAAPIFDYTGKVVGAIGCSAHTIDHSDEIIEKLLPDVTGAARILSARLGYSAEL